MIFRVKQLVRRVPRGFVQSLGVTLCLVSAAFGGTAAQVNEPPKIRDLLKTNVFEKLKDDREVIVHASLDDPEQGCAKGAVCPRKYEFYGVMTVRASLAQTRRVMLDFPLYARMIPYVEQVQYDPTNKEIVLQGGIWKFQLRSKVRFEEAGERYLKYRIVAGHFTGLAGEMIFEPKAEKQTIVYFRGGLSGIGWPPQFVIERGAEIVFGFTGRRMRKYIESETRFVSTPSATAGSGEGAGSSQEGPADGHSATVDAPLVAPVKPAQREAAPEKPTQGESNDNPIPQPRSGVRQERGKPFR